RTAGTAGGRSACATPTATSGAWACSFREAARNRTRATIASPPTPHRGRAGLLPLDVLALVLHVVDEDVLPQLVGGRVEHAALVDLGDLVHELLQVVVAVEHEGVDGDVLLRRALHFLQGLADRDRAGRVGEVRAAALEVRRRLAVRDHDDLAG